MEHKATNNNEFTYELNQLYENIGGIYHSRSPQQGYWSNLSKDQQATFLSSLEERSTLETVRTLFPEREKIIFDPMRSVGLKMLGIKEGEVGVDYGCMWGGLLTYAAKCCRAMLGVDQTHESLVFLKHRLKENDLSNCSLLQANLRETIDLQKTFDFAIVNGVLEWLPEEGKIELESFLSKKKTKFVKPKRNPREIQLEFLKMVHNNLKKDGRMYLAIENRYDYQYFFWKKDPHCNIFYTPFLPRKIANLFSNLYYGRPYVNYLYSPKKLEGLIKEAGFSRIEKYAVFPDYRFPQKIMPWKSDMSNYHPVYHSVPTTSFAKKVFRRLRRHLDTIVYKKLKLLCFAPSIVIIAKKD